MRREEQPVERPEPLRILESDYVGGGGGMFVQRKWVYLVGGGGVGREGRIASEDRRK